MAYKKILIISVSVIAILAVFSFAKAVPNFTTGLNVSSGNVGIGNTSPGQKLDLSGGIIRQSGYLVADAASNNLVANGDFESGGSYGWSTGTVVSGGYSGNYALQVNGNSTLLGNDFIPVDPTKDIFQLEAWVKKAAAGTTPGTLYFGYVAYDANKSGIYTAPCGTYCYFATSGWVIPVDGNWHKVSATTVGEGTSFPNFPVGTRYVRIMALVNYSGSGDAATLIDHVTLKRITKGPLIAGNYYTGTNWVDQHQYSTIYTNSSNQLIISSPGNVGVNKTPTSAFDVNGVITATSFSGSYSGTLNAANVSAGTFGGNTGGGNYIFPSGVIVDTTAGGTSSLSRTLTIKQSGNGQINFGAYPGSWTSALQIQNNTGSDMIWISPLDDGTNARFRAGGSGLDFYVGGTSADVGNHSLTLADNGLVGIGTVSPQVKLDVKGRFQADNSGTYSTTYNWAGSTIQTNSLELMDRYGGSISDGVYPTLTFHDYGNGGAQFSMQGSNTTLHLGSGQASSAGTIAGAGSYFSKLKVYGIVEADSFSGAYSGPVSAANISTGTFGANTGGGTYYFGGTTTNGASHYQFDGATYRDPGTYAPLLNIRQDNATAGITGFKPALSLYNSNGGLNTTVGLDFVSAEGATSAGNSVTLAGIMAIKESTGNVGGWSQGGLLLYTKNLGSRVDALRILNNGNVGIGTTEPAAKLDVRGNVTLGDSTNYTVSSTRSSGMFLKADTIDSQAAGDPLELQYGIAGNVVVYGADSNLIVHGTGNSTFAGNVGIGTTAPGAKLEIAGSWANTLLTGDNVIVKKPNYSGGGWARTLLNFQEYDGSSLYQIGAYGSNNTFNYGYLGVAYSDTILRWYPNKNFTIDGNVGIGTTAPKAKLHVFGTTEDNQIVGAGQTSVIEITNNYTSSYGRLGELIFSTSNGGGTNRLAAISSAYTNWDAAGLSGDLRFSTRTIGDAALSEKMRIIANGFVGIGTTAPGEKLDVSGNIKANHLVQGTLVARPYATWSAGGTTAGAIIIKLPGATGNYGMVHVQIDTYEYNGSAATTYICGGHNWNSAWYNYNCTTIGSSDKKVRLAFKDGQYAIVIGEAGSSWSYGHVVLSKITNGGYYSGTMNLGGAYTIYQDNSAESYTWISGNLNNRLAASRSEGRNYIDYARYVYNNGAYSGSGWVEPSDLGVRYASSAGYATSAGSATSAGNADTVDGQHFSWANNSNSPTYVWAADSNGSAYLANRSLMSVGYASSAGSLSANGANCPAGQYPLGVNASGAVESCTTDQTGGHGNGSNCSAGYYPLGVDASGNAESCAALSGASVGYASSAGNADTVDNFHLNQSVSTGANVSFGAVTASTVNASTVTATQFIYSDINLKKNITLISDPIEKIKQLNGVTFNWKKDGAASVGVIAQEVEKVFPELVSENEGYKTVQYSNLVAPLIEAVKAQQKEIESLKKQQLESSLALQLQINSLRAKLQALEMKFK